MSRHASAEGPQSGRRSVKGGGTCNLEELTDTLLGGRCTGKMELP